MVPAPGAAPSHRAVDEVRGQWVPRTVATPVSLRVQLLGDLAVTRPDGSMVDPHEWRTAKTADLLRILALSNGRPVRRDFLSSRLWHGSDPKRARGSLRTAASHIRVAVGFDCLERRPGAIVLVDAQVDADDLRVTSAQIRTAVAADDCDEAVRLARHAEALYVGDFRAADQSSGWASYARDDLLRVRLEGLLDAAGCAMEHRRFREAQDLSRIATRADPSSEAAHRALMQAHAELGEVAAALRVFESYRAHLADELGIDPSRITRDLHLRLLQDGNL
jgi:DNA-binding SARP family transcriptional activator